MGRHQDSEVLGFDGDTGPRLKAVLPEPSCSVWFPPAGLGGRTSPRAPTLLWFPAPHNRGQRLLSTFIKNW